jgi:hypothetical protein
MSPQSWIKREESSAGQSAQSTEPKITTSAPSPPYRNIGFVVAVEKAQQIARQIDGIYDASPKPVSAQLRHEAQELATLARSDERLVGRKFLLSFPDGV